MVRVERRLQPHLGDGGARDPAVLRRPGTYERLFALSAATRTGLAEHLAAAGVAAHVQGDGPPAAVLFTDREVVDSCSAFGSDRAKKRSFLLGLFRRGIFLNPMSTKLYLSTAHSDADVVNLLEATDAVLTEIAVEAPRATHATARATP